MKTVTDLRLLYKRQTGIYPIVDSRGNIDDPDYAKWLEDEAVKVIRSREPKKHTLQSVFDDQINLMNQHNPGK